MGLASDSHVIEALAEAAHIHPLWKLKRLQNLSILCLNDVDSLQEIKGLGVRVPSLFERLVGSLQEIKGRLWHRWAIEMAWPKTPWHLRIPTAGRRMPKSILTWITCPRVFCRAGLPIST